jgi:S-formylglutathione hydrolase FrmB
VLLVLAAALTLGACGATAGPAARAAQRAPAGATVVGQTRAAADVVDLQVRSPALGRTASVRLVTPRGWSQRAETGRRWPVLYLLHGCCDKPQSWVDNTDVESLRALRDVLVVTPEAGAVGFYSDWVAPDATGVRPRWETFHLVELRRLLERRYGASTRRAIAGLSMGGFGALSYAARHPRMFRAAASFSGVVHPLGNPGAVTAVVSGFGQPGDALWGDPETRRAVWRAHDPYSLARRLRGLPLYLSVGDGSAGPYDPPGKVDGIEQTLHPMNVALAARLRHLGIRVRTDFYGPGTHSWPYWQRSLHRALPMLLRALRR